MRRLSGVKDPGIDAGLILAAVIIAQRQDNETPTGQQSVAKAFALAIAVSHTR